MPRNSTWAFPMRDEWIVVIQSPSHFRFYDPMDCSMPGFLVFYYLPEFAQTPSVESIMPSNISSPIAPFSCIQFFPASRSFPMSWLLRWGGQSIGASASASFLPMNIQDWFPLRLIGLILLLSKGLLRVFSSTTVWKHQFLSTQPSLWSNSHICIWLLEKS